MTTRNERILTCEPCQYTTTSSSNFQRHVNTDKHLRVLSNTTDTTLQPTPYACICGKSYAHRGSLYNHQLNCMNRTTQFSAVSKITNECCDSLQCCDADKEIVHGLVAEYMADTKKHISAQIRRYLKRRDMITDPDVKCMMNEFYNTNITIESSMKQFTDIICPMDVFTPIGSTGRTTTS